MTTRGKYQEIKELIENVCIRGLKKGMLRNPLSMLFLLSWLILQRKWKRLICLSLNFVFQDQLCSEIRFKSFSFDNKKKKKGNVLLSRGSLMQHLCHLYWSETNTEVSWKLLYFPRVHQYPMPSPPMSLSFRVIWIGGGGNPLCIFFLSSFPPAGNIWKKLSFNWASCEWARLISLWQPGSSTKRELIKNYLISVVMWRQGKAMHMKL